MKKKHYLKKVFEPQSVAIVGASEDENSVGAQVLRNMREGGLKGEIYPVNPKERRVVGLQAYRNVCDIPYDVDLAVVVVPATAVAKAMVDCVTKGVKGAVLITAGFAETGGKGRILQDQRDA